jgi:hypothetical protein
MDVSQFRKPKNPRNLGDIQLTLSKFPAVENRLRWEVNRAYVERCLDSLGKLKSHVSVGHRRDEKPVRHPSQSCNGNDLRDEPNEMAVDYRGDFITPAA